MADMPNQSRPQEARRPQSPMPDGREPARAPGRAPFRLFNPPEAHEKYHIPDAQLDSATDYCWLPTRIVGAVNDKLEQYYRAGWMPAPASAFPEISGYGTEFPAKMIEMGLLKNVAADDPLIIDDQILVQRPKELSRAARKREQERANDQVANQMKRLQQAYRPMRDGGVSRRYRPMGDETYSAEEQ